VRSPWAPGPDGPQASPPPRRRAAGAERLPEEEGARDALGGEDDRGRLVEGAARGAEGAERCTWGLEVEGAERCTRGLEAEGVERCTWGLELEGVERVEGAAREDGAELLGDVIAEGERRAEEPPWSPRTAGALGRAEELPPRTPEEGAREGATDARPEGEREGATDDRPSPLTPPRGATRSDGRRGAAALAPPLAEGERGATAPPAPREAPARGVPVPERLGEPSAEGAAPEGLRLAVLDATPPGDSL
jgi:hypothetical protein